MSNITERTDAPKSFVRYKNPAGRGALEPSSASASGILATTDIEPLKHKSDAEEWSSTSRSDVAQGTSTETASNAAGTATEVASSATATVTGAAKLAYGTAVGDEQMKKEGSEQVWGKPSQ